jgi:hypothetical protein
MTAPATGPVDVARLLADIRAGKVAPRTASVSVCVDPSAALEADDILDRIDALQSRIDTAGKGERGVADPGPADLAAELADLEAEHDDAMAKYAAAVVTFTFRSQNETDRQELAERVAAYEAAHPGADAQAVVGTAQYSVDPVLSVDDVHDLIPVIGWAQFSEMVSCWQVLVFGRPSAPKSRRPSRGLGTVTR